MVQLNLLPNVKLEYIKAQRMRSLVVSVSVIVTAIAILILVILFIADLAQKKSLSDLNSKIATETAELQSKPQIDKVLTVQNQLESLTALHASKPAASRLFTTYLNEVTPATASINSLQIDFNQHTATLQGTADSLATVDEYVDTLKFTTYTSTNVKTATKAFSNVVLSAFGVNANPQDPTQAASFTITLAFDKTIFDITQNVTLTVPNQITTRSLLEQPTDLFKTAPPGSSITQKAGS